MISLSQTMLMGMRRVHDRQRGHEEGGAGGETKGLTLGWDPTLALVLALAGTTLSAFCSGTHSTEHRDLLLMIALTYSVVGILLRRSGDRRLAASRGIANINSYTPPFVGDIVENRNRLYYIALGVASPSTPSFGS